MAFLFAGIYYFKTRSKLKEGMESIIEESGPGKKRLLETIGELVLKLAHKADLATALDRFDKKLFLADRPLNLKAQEFAGGWIVLVAVSLVVSILLVFIGFIPPLAALFIVFVSTALPHLLVDSAAEAGRVKLSNEVIDLVTSLELGVSAGLSETRVIEWAAEGEGTLAIILKTALKEVAMGKLTYVIFNKLADDYNIPQAREVAVSLKQAGVHGVTVGQVLIELSRDLRGTREREAEIQIVKLKPTIDSILTFAVMVAAMTLMIGPIVAENLGMLDQMLGGGF